MPVLNQWKDALLAKRIAQAKSVFESLYALDWNHLSERDKALREALGYLCLERDDVDLLGLTDALEAEDAK